jgi:hypothetical protein
VVRTGQQAARTAQPRLLALIAAGAYQQGHGMPTGRRGVAAGLIQDSPLVEQPAYPGGLFVARARSTLLLLRRRLL